ncbi:MAG: AMP-binding protein [Treponema sp.]|nr:AMP-binding protein [Treponema sp.]
MLKFEDYISDIPDVPHRNFAEFLRQIAADHGNKDAILYRKAGEKDFVRWTYGRFDGECRRIAQGLLAAGLTKGDRVLLWAENRPEWMAVWMGALIAGLSIVPVDFLATNQECRNIMKITRARAFFYSATKVDFAKDLSADRASGLAVSVRLDNDEFSRFGQDAGRQPLPEPEDIDGDSPASIVFTSGTTGVAKGVTLSHRNIIANASAAVRILGPNSTDVFIDVLPLHHTYPTTCCFITPFSLGIPVVVVEKIVGKVVIDDIRDGGVTFLIAVPLLFEKMMTALDSGYNTKIPGFLRALLRPAREKALREADLGRPEYGRKKFLFFRKKAGLASVKIIVAGGGPLNRRTADFFDSLGFNIVHGYGMSENSPLISVNTTRHKRNASVGLPVSYTEVRIIEPNAEGIGEIACTSPSVMIGYFENPAATEEVIREIDGKRWLLTGDLGKIDEDGFLYILGRKKNLIVTSAGKNIYPEEIEGMFASPEVAEVLVVGRRAKGENGETIFAVIVPNLELIGEKYPEKEEDEDFVRSLLKAEVEKANRNLPIYKRITGFAIRSEPFEKNAQQKIKRFLYKSYETEAGDES